MSERSRIGERTIVLKFGGSVVRGEETLPAVVQEIHRWRREGWRVVAVVSAPGGTTDTLLARARAYSEGDERPDAEATALLLATGEATSAALLGLALARAGLDANVADAARIGLKVRGPNDDALPVEVNRTRVRALLEDAPVLVVPGFIGVNEEGATALLGRGGSDLTAIFLAERLGARCRLIKDVEGLYEWDPAEEGREHRRSGSPGRYLSLHWNDALQLDGRIVQHKAIRFARDRGLEFEVAGVNGPGETVIGQRSAAMDGARRNVRRPLRVGLLGLGNVGGGVWRALSRQRELFEVAGIAVRDPRRHAGTAPGDLLTTRARDVVASGCDIIVDTIGGVSPAGELIAEAIALGADVVTANKSVIAARGADLERLAAARGRRLLYSAAVGGQTPVLETIEAILAEDPESITGVEGVINATTNFILERMKEGENFEGALVIAQQRGYAEADASADIDGWDAANKIVLVARAAFGVWLPVSRVRVKGIREVDARLLEDARRIGGAVRLVAEATKTGGGIRLSVEPRVICAGDALRDVPGAWNRVVIHREAGGPIALTGSGAGRWPTTESVMGDVARLWRERTCGTEGTSIRAFTKAGA